MLASTIHSTVETHGLLLGLLKTACVPVQDVPIQNQSQDGFSV